MKIAVVALTKGGSELARKIAGQELAKVDLYIPQKFALEGECSFDQPLHQLVPTLLRDYAGVAFIMALGIVVRVVSPHLQSKRVDPAIVCLDEGGKFVISVASGHLGGANELAISLAQQLVAVPVITTATDVQGKIAFDVLARKLDLVIEPFQNLKTLNSAVVNGERVKVFSELPLEKLGYRQGEQSWQGVEVKTLSEFDCETIKAGDYLIFITNRDLQDISSLSQVNDSKDKPVILFLRPRNVIAGVGCRRGVAQEQVLAALTAAFKQAGRSMASLKKLVSVDIKADEVGLLEAGKTLSVPLEFVSRSKIAAFLQDQPQLEHSDFVKAQIGVGGVCEPAALMAGNQASLILSKQKLQGITVALSEERL